MLSLDYIIYRLNGDDFLNEYWLLYDFLYFLDYNLFDYNFHWNLYDFLDGYDSIDHSGNHDNFLNDFFNLYNLWYFHYSLNNFLFYGHDLLDSFKVLLDLHYLLLDNVDWLLVNNFVIDYSINLNNLILVKNYRNFEINRHVNSIFCVWMDWHLYYSVNRLDYLNVVIVFNYSRHLSHNFLSERNWYNLFNNLYFCSVYRNFSNNFYLEYHFICPIKIDWLLNKLINLFDHFNSILDGD